MYIDTAIKAALAAGEAILEIYNDPAADFSVERKADNSPLTVADKASHRIIQQELHATGQPVLSEEGRDIPYSERKSWETFWLVDPLDGTKEFIKRNGEFTVNIALIRNGQPVLGVIYVPVTRTLYAGDAAQGAWKLEDAPASTTLASLEAQGQSLPLPQGERNYTVAGSRSHGNAATEAYMEERKKAHPRMKIISRGSSLKICMVAEGTADEYPRFGPTMEWDTAAGHAIARAAGKRCLLPGHQQELTYNKADLMNPHFIVK